MSVAGNLEEHDSKRKPEDPDWALLYSYMVSILRGDPSPDLGPVGEYMLPVHVSIQQIINIT